MPGKLAAYLDIERASGYRKHSKSGLIAVNYSNGRAIDTAVVPNIKKLTIQNGQHFDQFSNGRAARFSNGL